MNPRKLNGDSFAFDFNARNDTRYSVEIMANIASETWSNVYLLPTPTTPGLLTVTNLIPDAEPYRWFRIRAGYQPYFLWAD